MRRAAVHAALGDPGRLAIVDALLLGEASPTELQRLLDMPSNLLAHHVRTLEKVGVLTRHRSEADRRRTYLTLAPGAFDTLHPIKVHDAVRVVVRMHPQLRWLPARRRAVWNDTSPVPATSAGTHPPPPCTPAPSPQHIATTSRWLRFPRSTSTTSPPRRRRSRLDRPPHHRLRRCP